MKRTCSRCKQEKEDNKNYFYSNHDLYCIKYRKEYTINWQKKKKTISTDVILSSEVLTSLIDKLNIMDEKLEKVGEAVGMDFTKD